MTKNLFFVVGFSIIRCLFYAYMYVNVFFYPYDTQEK